jgi:hypothetical protein
MTTEERVGHRSRRLLDYESAYKSNTVDRFDNRRPVTILFDKSIPILRSNGKENARTSYVDARGKAGLMAMVKRLLLQVKTNLSIRHGVRRNQIRSANIVID